MADDVNVNKRALMETDSKPSSDEDDSYGVASKKIRSEGQYESVYPYQAYLYLRFNTYHPNTAWF